MSSNRCKGTENLLIMQDFELFFMIPATFFTHFSMIPTIFLTNFSMIPAILGGLFSVFLSPNMRKIAKCRLFIIKKWAFCPLLQISMPTAVIVKLLIVNFLS